MISSSLSSLAYFQFEKKGEEGRRATRSFFFPSCIPGSTDLQCGRWSLSGEGRKSNSFSPPRLWRKGWAVYASEGYPIKMGVGEKKGENKISKKGFLMVTLVIFKQRGREHDLERKKLFKYHFTAVRKRFEKTQVSWLIEILTLY